MQRWLIYSIAALIIAASAWWMFGSVTLRATQPIPAGHWLASHLRSDGLVDTWSAAAHLHPEPGPPDENLPALLVGIVGPAALAPDPSPELLGILGMVPELAGGAHLELPETVKPLSADEEKQVITQLREVNKPGAPERMPPSPPTLVSELSTAAKRPWSDAELPAAALWLERHRPVLDAIATWRPLRCRIPWTHDQDATRPVRLNLFATRTLIEACAAEAFHALALDDCATAVRFATALYRIAVAVSTDGDSQDLVHGGMWMNCATSVMEAVLDRPNLDDALLVPWNEAVATTPWKPDLARVLDGDPRLLMIATMQSAPGQLSSAELKQVIRGIDACFEDVVSIARIQSWTEQQQAWRHFNSTDPVASHRTITTYNGWWGRAKLLVAGPYVRRELVTEALLEILVSIGKPDVEVMSGMLRQAQAHLALVRAAVAWRHGPTTGDLPLDPFGVGPLRSRDTSSGWRIWSVGKNGVDDNGRQGSGRDDVFLDLPIPR